MCMRTVTPTKQCQRKTTFKKTLFVKLVLPVIYKLTD